MYILLNIILIGEYDEYTSVENFEVNFRIRDLRKLLRTTVNPIYVKQIKVELTSWLAIKHLIDQSKR